ncbi:MAG: hypothetical protein IPK93_11125 [Solirubrobacterales bacterium]|nr:hypothetical protein [Solirubrobacterales bacterium]
MATNSALLRFGFDGTRDSSFGVDGRIDIDELDPTSDSIVDAAVAADGGIFVAGAGTRSAGGSGPQSVVKLRPDGEIDSSFGTGGIYRGDSLEFHFQELAFDGAGRILLAGDSYDGSEDIDGYGRPVVAVTRLMTNGDVDVSFGDAGLAKSASLGYVGPLSWNLRLNGIFVDETGQILVLGGATFVNLKYADDKTGWARFADDGSPLSVSSDSFPAWAPAFAELSDGDFALADGPGGRINPDGSGGFSDGRSRAQLDPWPSPIGFQASSISVNSFTGHLLSAGYLGGATGGVCEAQFSKDEYPCRNYRGAVVKIDAGSGEPVASFGNGGVATSSPNECAYGQSPDSKPASVWKPCRIMPPRISAKANFKHGASRRPSIRIDLEFKAPPLVPLFASQRLTVRLPKRLKSKRGKVRSRLRIKPRSASEGTFSVSRKKRKISINFMTSETQYDPEFEDPPANQPIGVSIVVRRGAIKAIARKLRKRKLHFRASGSFSPGKPEDAKWWGNSSIRKTKRARPVGAKAHR